MSMYRVSFSSLPRAGKWIAFSSALLAGTIFCIAAQAEAGVPQGVFCLLPAGNRAATDSLANPNVDGISIRQTWADLEPAAGQYDWTYLDSEVARAAASGKSVLIRILTQSGKPQWVTDAIKAAGGAFFSTSIEGESLTFPVFWDPTFLAKKKAMIAALGAHFGNNSAVKVIAIAFANANSEDWSVPHTPADIEQWAKLGYTSQKMLDAGKALIDATMVAFPTQYVTLAAGANGNLDSDASYVARNAIATARQDWPGRLIVQKNTLASFTPPAPGTGTVYDVLWDSRPQVAAQMLSAAYDDPSYRDNGGVPASAESVFRRTIDAGVAYGTKFIEIYQTDVLHLPDEIVYAHNALFGATNGAPPSSTPRPPTNLRRVP